MMETLAPCDGVDLARIVRAVAAQSRRTFKRPANRDELRDLLRAVDSLEYDLHQRPLGELSRWVASLRRQIEAHRAGLV